jgi:hypothetical protein
MSAMPNEQRDMPPSPTKATAEKLARWYQPTPEQLEQIHQALEEYRALRTAFIDEQLAPPEGGRLTDGDREDLGRRLVEVLVREHPRMFLTIQPPPDERTYHGVSRPTSQLAGNARTLDPPIAGQREFPIQAGGSIRSLLADVWPNVYWNGWRTEHAALLSARVILSAATAAGDELARDPKAEGRLDRAVRERMLDAKGVPPATGDTAELNGMYPAHARAIAFLRTLANEFTDPKSRVAARLIADVYHARWTTAVAEPEKCAELWRDPMYLPCVLADVLWQTEVRSKLAAECRAPTPVIAASVAIELAAACFSPGRKFELCDGKGKALGADGTVLLEADVPSMDPGHFEALQRGAELFKGLTGQRLLFYVPRQLHLQKGTPNEGTILVPGGYGGLAEAIGEHSKKAPEKLVDLLRAGWLWHRTWPGGEVCGLWTFGWQRRASPGQHGILWLTPAPFFSPYYAIKRLDRDRHFSWPVLAEPSFVGRELDHAAQNAFLFLLGGAFVEHRVELVQEGGATLPSAELAALAARVGLPPKLVPEVLERWTDTDGPLERVGIDRYILKDTERYRAARKWLLGAGELTLKNRARRQRASRR